jgi:transposase InsO family protein
MLGIDSDNGGEFINTQLLAWCRENKVAFTRSRPYRKNDNCFVEQKNGDIVRKSVGYYRYDTEEETDALA